jgi:hypothetical protein
MNFGWGGTGENLNADGGLWLMDAAQRTPVDIRKDIAGCIAERYDSRTGERFGPAAAEFKTLDMRRRQYRTYFLLSVAASPDCNIQNQCGAAFDHGITLIWLSLKDDLSVDGKQSLVMNYCGEGRAVTLKSVRHPNSIQRVLTIEFEEILADTKKRAS